MDTDMESKDNANELNNIMENNFCRGTNPTNCLSSIPANLKNIINPQLSESSYSGFYVKQESSGSSLNDSSVKDNATVSVSENIHLETQSINNHSNVTMFYAHSMKNNSIAMTKTGELPVSNNILKNNDNIVVTATNIKNNCKTISNNPSPLVKVSINSAKIQPMSDNIESNLFARQLIDKYERNEIEDSREKIKVPEEVTKNKKVDTLHSDLKEEISENNKQNKFHAQGIAERLNDISYKKSTNIGTEKGILKEKNKNSSKKSICSSDVGSYRELRFGKWDSVLFKNTTKNTNKGPKPASIRQGHLPQTNQNQPLIEICQAQVKARDITAPASKSTLDVQNHSSCQAPIQSPSSRSMVNQFTLPVISHSLQTNNCSDHNTDTVISADCMVSDCKIKKKTCELVVSNSLFSNDNNEVISATAGIADSGEVSINDSLLVKMSNPPNFIENYENMQSTNTSEENIHPSVNSEIKDATNINNKLFNLNWNTSNVEQVHFDMQRDKSLDNQIIDHIASLPSLIPYDTEFIEETPMEENPLINMTLLKPIWNLQRVNAPVESLCPEELALHFKILGYKKCRMEVGEFCKKIMKERFMVSQPNTVNSNVQIRSENQSTLNLQTNQLVIDTNIAIKNELCKASTTNQVDIFSKIKSEVTSNFTNVDKSQVINETSTIEQNSYVERNHNSDFKINLASSEVQRSKSKVNEKVFKRTSDSVTLIETTSSSGFVSKFPNVENSVPEIENTVPVMASKLTVKDSRNIVQTFRSTSDKNFIANKSNTQRNLCENSNENTRGSDNGFSHGVQNSDSYVAAKNCRNAIETSAEKRVNDTAIEQEAEPAVPAKKILTKQLADNSKRKKIKDSREKIKKPKEVANNKKVDVRHSVSKEKISDKKNKQSECCHQGRTKNVIAHSHEESPNIEIEKDALKDKNKNSSKEWIYNCQNDLRHVDNAKPSSIYKKHLSQMSRNQPSMEIFQAQVNAQDITVPASKSTLNAQNHSCFQASIQTSSRRSMANQFTPPVLAHSLQTNNCSVRDSRLRKHGTIKSQNTQTVSQVPKPESNYNNPSPDLSDMSSESRNKKLLTAVNTNQLTSDISSWNNFPLSKDQELNNQGKNTFAPQSPLFTPTPPPSPVTSDSNEFITPENRSSRGYTTILQHYSPHSFDPPTHGDPRQSPLSPFSSPSPSRNNDNTHRRNSTDLYKVNLSLTELNNSLGKKIIPPNDALMLILSWVPSWLREVELPNQAKLPPICGKPDFPLKNVNLVFINALEHFNTFFPLMLHDLFFRLLDTQKHSYKFRRLNSLILDINKIEHVGEMVEVVAKMIHTKKMPVPSEGQIGMVTFTFTDGLNKDAFVYISDVKCRETDGGNLVLCLYLKTYFNLSSVDKTKKITLVAFYHLEVLHQIKSLTLLDRLAVRDGILNPTKLHCTKIALERVGTVHTSPNIISRAVEKIKEGLAIENPDESKILIIDSFSGTDPMSTMIALVEDMKSSENETEKRRILFCVRSHRHLENVGLRLLSSATSDSAINIVMLTKHTSVGDPKLKKLTLHEQVNRYVEMKKNEVMPSKLSLIDLKTEAQKSVLENCDIVLSNLLVCYEPTVDYFLGMQGSSHFSFCIIDEAYTCTEPECCLPFLYGIKKLALVGDPSVKPAVVCSSIMKYNYYRSLAERISKRLLSNDV